MSELAEWRKEPLRSPRWHQSRVHLCRTLPSGSRCWGLAGLVREQLKKPENLVFALT